MCIYSILPTNFQMGGVESIPPRSLRYRKKRGPERVKAITLVPSVQFLWSGIPEVLAAIKTSNILGRG